MAVGFSDSIDGNLDLVKELLRGVPPSKRNVAKRAAVMVENVFEQIKKDYRGDPAAALGMTLAFLTITQRLVQSDQAGEREGLIQLLS